MLVRLGRILLWAAGALLLIFLIKYPIEKTDQTWKTWSLPLAGKTIVIDPGHGGMDGGAVGRDETLEKEITLLISKQLQSYLQQSGALVYLTRETDKDLAADETKSISQRKSEDIRNRLKFIDTKKPDLFLSVHLNALPDKQWDGAQTFYYPSVPDNKLLAESIQGEIIHNLENTTRSALTIQGIYLLKHANAPGALVEVGFLSNDREREMLKQPAYQQQMAGSIYYGVLRYVSEQEELAEDGATKK